MVQRIAVGAAVLAMVMWLPSQSAQPLAAQAPAQAPVQAPTTFSEHVAPILFANCSGCHRPGEAAPFPLLGYRDARPMAKAIATAATSRTMPPWKAGASDYAFRDARR